MIGEEWVSGSGETFATIDPATGNVTAHYSAAGEAEVEAAVAAGRRALADPRWAALKPHERAALLYRFGALIDERAEVLAEAQMRNNGKTLAECRAQAASAAGVFRYYAAVCETTGAEIAPARGPSLTMTVHEPAGVVVAITPWNSPLTLEAQKLAPILAAGNAVILKSSEITPAVGLEYARIAIDAGFPPGVVGVLLGDRSVGTLLIAHPGVDMISFTGGTAAGRSIAEAAGRRLVPLIAELGGKSPNMVFADADLAAAARGAAYGIFSSGGQSCIAGSRIFVERSAFDSFLRLLIEQAAAYRMGMPTDPRATLGPMATFHHREHVRKVVAEAVATGGRLVVGGEVPTVGALAHGAFYPATIITDVSNRSGLCQNEVFGPVAAVLPFDGESDLIEQANDSVFGLAAGVWTGDYRKAWRVARAVKAGTVWINTYKELSISAPFGGFKDSGVGREKGLQGMRIYTQSKSLLWQMN
ncbi:MAG TPA: aldehyde dehydrogenase family protein [Bauldia sp.]|nr:aldehyde dehydrogenase family protein [Bauldia sp.]